jgi:hypothetical protein
MHNPEGFSPEVIGLGYRTLEGAELDKLPATAQIHEVCGGGMWMEIDPDWAGKPANPAWTYRVKITPAKTD